MTGGMPPQPQSGWSRTLWTLVFWALLVVGSIALVQFSSSRRQEAAGISYSELVRELERGNVAAVEITGRTKLNGDFKSLLLFAGRREAHFTTILPFESSDAWVSTLLAKGVEVRGGREQQSVAVFLLSLLPYALIPLSSAGSRTPLFLPSGRRPRPVYSAAPRSCYSAATHRAHAIRPVAWWNAREPNHSAP